MLCTDTLLTIDSFLQDLVINISFSQIDSVQRRNNWLPEYFFLPVKVAISDAEINITIFH